MNKVLVLLMVAFAFIACSSDSDSKESNPDGQFVAHNGTILLMVEFDNGKCWRLTGFKDGRVFGQCSVFSTTGQYPDYTYSGDGFSLVCHYTDANSFSASVSGRMPVLYTGGYTDVSGTFNFTRTDTPLDVNGDGILDSPQSL